MSLQDPEVVMEVSELSMSFSDVARKIVGVGWQVRVVEQVTLEDKLGVLVHRPSKLYPIGLGARYAEPDDDTVDLPMCKTL